MRKSKIKVWVLTGDKIQTATTIGYSCKLLQHDMNIFHLTSTKLEDITQDINKILETISNQSKNIPCKNALIVAGDTLVQIRTSKDYIQNLLKIAMDCESVLCCRMTPEQKGKIVTLVKENKKDWITLAIGDGANDVNMLTKAHVGLGIRGLEGSQAARCSDFAIGEFSHIKRLLYYYGRDTYRKNSNLILFSFYKNILVVVPQFWYSFLNFFSGVSLYDRFMYQFYNVFFTSLPIVLYAVFDHDCNDDEFLQNTSRYYTPGPKSIKQNIKIFIGIQKQQIYGLI